MAAESAVCSEPAAREVRGAPDPDAEIVELLARSEHREALRLCATSYGASLGRLCVALVGSRAEADDLVQETLLDAHSSFAGYRGEGSLRAWLFSIARRKCARHLEHRSRRELRSSLVPPAEDGANALEALVTTERAHSARAALSTIRPSEREALVLRYLGELSFREVGQACGIDEAAARKRVSRALARLREIVGRNER